MDWPGWWAPLRRLWWIGVLFAIGSTCFLVGPLTAYANLVGGTADAATFFVGSLFFTSAATLQWLESMRVGDERNLLRLSSSDWWSSGIQWLGTLAFNVSTFQAMQSGLDAESYDTLVWRPDWRGSIAFLVSGAIAYYAVAHSILPPRLRPRVWWIAAVNFLGCIAFGLSAAAAYWLPGSGLINENAANAFTAVGGLCFLIGAALLLPAPRVASEPVA